jgi:GNAT superfamily N-acetyltransferase
MPNPTEPLLQGAYDLHVHLAPDVVPRAQDGTELAYEAQQAGMAGMLIKDHTAPTAGAAHVLNQAWPEGAHFYSALVLNPPVGGLNSYAVAAALREGVDVVYMPTYAAAHQIVVQGADAFAPAYPRPGDDWAGISLLDAAGELVPEVWPILDLIAEHDAVLATGHIAPAEILALLPAARDRGVSRVLVTHASWAVPGLSLAGQLAAVGYGAMIEHCLMGTLGETPALRPATIRDQVRGVGVHNCLLSSDLGQAANGPVVAGFAGLLGKMRQAGMTDAELRILIEDSPRRLLGNRAR